MREAKGRGRRPGRIRLWERPGVAGVMGWRQRYLIPDPTTASWGGGLRVGWGGLCPWAGRPFPLSPACPPARGLPRKAHRYLNFDFILFYFISLLPRAGAVPPGTAAPHPPPRASLYYCNKCAYKGAGSGARWGLGGAAERGCNFPKPEPEGEWAGWRWRRGRRGRG